MASAECPAHGGVGDANKGAHPDSQSSGAADTNTSADTNPGSGAGTSANIPPRRRPRRAKLAAAVGSDPSPFDPPTEVRGDHENDERLRADRPPHWG